MSKTEKWLLAYIIVCLVAVHYYRKSSRLESELSQTKVELQESQDREYGIEAENTRLISKVRSGEIAQDNLEECQSEKTFVDIDLQRCKRELDIAIRYGAKCLKQNLSLLEKLSRRK